MAAGRRSASMWRSRTSFAPSSTIGWRRRSIRSPSSSSPSLFSARRTPRGRAAPGGLGHDRRGRAAASDRLRQHHRRRARARPSSLSSTSRSSARCSPGCGRSRAAAPSSPRRRSLSLRPRSPSASPGRWRVRGGTMITGTLSRYFGLRFLNTVVGSFIGVFALRADRLRRADAPRRRLAQRVRAARRQDLAFSRAADHRAHPAVLRADRRDVVLSRPVAPPRTGGCARGRHVGLAVRRAGADRGIRVRRLRHHRLQPHRRGPAGALQAPGSRVARRASLHGLTRTRTASGCASAAPTAVDHQCQDPAASRAQLGKVSVFAFDNAGQFLERIEAKTAILEPGHWRLEDARIYEAAVRRRSRRPIGSPPT